MSSAPPTRAFAVHHVQIARAVVAAVAAAMITFSPDHSASVGLSVFSGFAITTAFVLFLAAWLVAPAGRRGRVVLPGAIDLVAGMVAGVGAIRGTTLFFALVITWAVLAGLVELLVGATERAVLRREGGVDASARLQRSQARDAITVGVLGLVLAVGLLIVVVVSAVQGGMAAQDPHGVTAITIGVGLFGGYAAIAAVYLGIAGFSPRPDAVFEPAAVSAAPDEHSGGAA